MASGSEVEIACEVAERLEGQGIGADVISVPCMDIFEQQDAAYKADLLPDADPGEILRVSIEAGVTQGWERYTMARGLNIGIDRFGASAPAEQLFEKFGLTADAIVPQILEKIKA
jgi:transketolase